MNRSKFLLLSALFCSAPVRSQTPPPPPAAAPPTSPSAPSLKARGPEAVSQQDPNRVVATIAGKQITAKEAMDLLKPLGPDDRKRFEANLSGLVQQLYMTSQIADEAAKQKLDQQSPWKEQLQMARSNILTQAYLSKEASANSAAADPRAYYDSHTADYEQVKLSLIQVAFSPPGTPAAGATAQRTESQALEKANDLEKKIKSGGDFAALARAESDHQQTSVKGGDLPPMMVGDPGLPAPIKAAVMKLQPGQVSDPIRVQGGFFIFKLESRNTLGFDQARPTIAQKIQNDRNQIVLKQELEKYKVDVRDPDFFNMSSVPSLNVPSKPPLAPAKPPSN
jgi:parvulin-like peptidyl-prolyl isomerase